MRPLSKAAPVLALGLSLLAGDTFAAARSGGLDLAALREKLQAASSRKHSGAEKVLRGNVWLRGRPTADADNAGNLSAGTVVRQSNFQVTNAAGIWRHVETQSGKNGWLLEADLAP